MDFTETSIAPEFEDENRITILTLLKQVLHNPEITPVAWLCLWLADLDCLQTMYTMATLPGGQAAVLLALQSVDEKFLQTWIDQVVPACPSHSVVFARQPSHIPDIEGPMNRCEIGAQRRYCRADLEDETQVCLARDQRSCILTHATDSLKIGHIIPSRNQSHPSPSPSPSSSPRDTGADTFWETLSLFWKQDTVAAWARELNAQNNGTNMLTMAPHVLATLNKARFALQPVSHFPADTLTVKFVWLKFRREYFPTRGERVRILRRPVVGYGLGDRKNDVGPRGLKLWDCDTEEKVYSGKLVSFRVGREWADDGRPLPSWELLCMQWVLRRIVAFSGMVDGDGYGDWNEGEDWGGEGQWMEPWTGEGETTEWDSSGGNSEGDWYQGPEEEEEDGWKADNHEHDVGDWAESVQLQEESSGWYPGTPQTPETETEQVEPRCQTMSSISSRW